MSDDRTVGNNGALRLQELDDLLVFVIDEIGHTTEDMSENMAIRRIVEHGCQDKNGVTFVGTITGTRKTFSWRTQAQRIELSQGNNSSWRVQFPLPDRSVMIREAKA